MIGRWAVGGGIETNAIANDQRGTWEQKGIRRRPQGTIGHRGGPLSAYRYAFPNTHGKTLQKTLIYLHFLRKELQLSNIESRKNWQRIRQTIKHILGDFLASEFDTKLDTKSETKSDETWETKLDDKFDTKLGINSDATSDTNSDTKHIWCRLWKP